MGGHFDFILEVKAGIYVMWQSAPVANWEPVGEPRSSIYALKSWYKTPVKPGTYFNGPKIRVLPTHVSWSNKERDIKFDKTKGNYKTGPDKGLKALKKRIQ